MAKIYSYLQVTDEYTTYTVTEPDYNEGDERITELCTIDGVTYISVPDSLALPDQPEQVVLTEVTLTDELREKIKSTSPHIKLIDTRVVEDIRGKYTDNDEFKMLRVGTGAEYDDYKAHIESCVAWGQAEKALLGFGQS